MEQRREITFGSFAGRCLREAVVGSWDKADLISALVGLALGAVALEKAMYSVADVASLTRFSLRTITRLFEDEPGVLILERPGRLHKRRYRSIRIPRHVYERRHTEAFRETPIRLSGSLKGTSRSVLARDNSQVMASRASSGRH